MQWILKRIEYGRYRAIALMALAAAICFGCSGGDSGGNETDPSRSFAMGFTPWPYEATIDAVSDTYQKIQAHGDIITHQLDGGVPWPEAFDGNATYSADLEGDIALRLANTEPDMPVCLAVTPLRTLRDAPADYWGDSTGMARPVPWNGYDFGDWQLAAAYTNYLLNLIDRFQPAYCNYAIEATEYIINHPDKAADLLDFLQQVYDALKLAHPDLPLFISVTLKAPGSSNAQLVQSYATRIASCSDLLGISTYGYVFYGHADSGNPHNLPVDWLSQAQAYAPGKTLAIAETGWIAENLFIPAYGNLTVDGSAAWQADYLRKLFAEADRLDVAFITWFSVIDFDTLWQDTLGQDPLARIWRDTGLYDGDVQPREALTVWEAWFGRPVR